MRHKQKPVIIQDVQVENYAAEGKCISRVEGKAVFIENVVPGDVVDVQLYKNKKDWAEGFPLHFKKYSSERVQPFCKHFGVCGGCQWQHLPYEKQLQYKQQQVIDNLTRIGKIQSPKYSPLPAAGKPFATAISWNILFLTSDIFPTKNSEHLSREEAATAYYKDVAGYHAKGVFDKVVEIDICHLQDEPTNALRKAIAQYAKEINCLFTISSSIRGGYVPCRYALTTTGELMVNIVLGYEGREHEQALQKILLQQFPQITTILFTINTKKKRQH